MVAPSAILGAHGLPPGRSRSSSEAPLDRLPRVVLAGGAGAGASVQVPAEVGVVTLDTAQGVADAGGDGLASAFMFCAEARFRPPRPTARDNSARSASRSSRAAVALHYQPSRVTASSRLPLGTGARQRRHNARSTKARPRMPAQAGDATRICAARTRLQVGLFSAADMRPCQLHPQPWREELHRAAVGDPLPELRARFTEELARH